MTQETLVPATVSAKPTIPAMTDTTPHLTPDELHASIVAQLEDDQAQDLVSIPLEGKSSIADYMIVASGRSTRQVAAMAQQLENVREMQRRGEVPTLEELKALIVAKQES